MLNIHETTSLSVFNISSSLIICKRQLIKERVNSPGQCQTSSAQLKLKKPQIWENRHKLVRETKPSKLNSLPTVPGVVVQSCRALSRPEEPSREETVAPVTKCTSWKSRWIPSSLRQPTWSWLVGWQRAACGTNLLKWRTGLTGVRLTWFLWTGGWQGRTGRAADAS